MSAPRDVDAPPVAAQREPEELLEQLDARQKQAVVAPRGPVVVVAGPGTGKTRTITHRIAYGVATGQTQPGRVLAVTFTRRAAGEMRGRLASLGVGEVAARTFHSAASRQLRHFWPRLVGGPMPQVLRSPADALAAALAEAGGGLAAVSEHVRPLQAEIDWAKAVMVAPEDYAEAARRAGRRAPRGDVALVAEAYEAYEAFKVRHGRLDLTDLVLLLAAGIEDDRGVAEEIRSAYRHLVVDEYQDVSPAQERLLRAWLGDSDDLCVVGDPMQTIYSFAGASVGPLLDMPRRFPHAAVVTLDTCYRCSPEILRLAEGITRDMPATGVGGGRRLRSACPPGEVRRTEAATPAEERVGLAERCGQVLAGGVAAGDVAVLVRTRAQAVAVAGALAGRGLPVFVRDERAVLELPEAVEALALLRIAARLEAVAAPDDGRVAVADQVADVVSGLGLSRTSRTTVRGLVLDSIVATVRGYTADRPEATLAEAVGMLARMAEDGVEPVLDAVTVATMHASKGREWEVVFVPFLVDGAGYATPTAAVREEEQRLLYVATTRARRVLALSWHRHDPARRPVGGPREPTSLLPGLRGGVDAPDGGSRGTGASGATGATGSSGAGTSGASRRTRSGRPPAPRSAPAADRGVRG